MSSNKNIPPAADAVCFMPESEVHVPMSNPKDCFVRQYPPSINSFAKIDKQIKKWLQKKIVERCKPSSGFHSPLITVKKKDKYDQLTKLRVCCDLRRIDDAAIDENYHINLCQSAHQWEEMLLIPDLCLFICRIVVESSIQMIDMRRLSDIDEWPIPKTASRYARLWD